MNKQIFYNCQKLTYQEKIYLMENAKSQSFRWWVDHLDCSVSAQRKKVQMNWQEIIQKFRIGDHFICIQRSYPDLRTQKDYGEIGFSTSDGYYLFILVELSLFNQIMQDYQLEAD
jgi:hypothetical protein